MIGAVAEEVAEEMKCRYERRFLLECKCADGSGENVLAYGAQQERLVVVDEGVEEKEEEVFDHIRQFFGGEIIHNPEECKRLLFEEAVDGLRGGGVDKLGATANSRRTASVAQRKHPRREFSKPDANCWARVGRRGRMAVR